MLHAWTPSVVHSGGSVTSTVQSGRSAHVQGALHPLVGEKSLWSACTTFATAGESADMELMAARWTAGESALVTLATTGDSTETAARNGATRGGAPSWIARGLASRRSVDFLGALAAFAANFALRASLPVVVGGGAPLLMRSSAVSSSWRSISPEPLVSISSKRALRSSLGAAKPRNAMPRRNSFRLTSFSLSFAFHISSWSIMLNAFFLSATIWRSCSTTGEPESALRRTSTFGRLGVILARLRFRHSLTVFAMHAREWSIVGVIVVVALRSLLSWGACGCPIFGLASALLAWVVVLGLTWCSDRPRGAALAPQAASPARRPHSAENNFSLGCSIPLERSVRPASHSCSCRPLT
jgi:hypothetical protein